MTYKGSLVHTLVVDELGFCCIYSFLRETKKYSAKKVSEALGVTPWTIGYWRAKKIRKIISPCQDCRQTHISLECRTSSYGKPYFVRFAPRCTDGSSGKTRKT